MERRARGALNRLRDRVVTGGDISGGEDGGQNIHALPHAIRLLRIIRPPTWCFQIHRADSARPVSAEARSTPRIDEPPATRSITFTQSPPLWSMTKSTCDQNLIWLTGLPRSS